MKPYFVVDQYGNTHFMDFPGKPLSYASVLDFNSGKQAEEAAREMARRNPNTQYFVARCTHHFKAHVVSTIMEGKCLS